MKKRLLHIALFAVFIFPLLFQPLHVIIHHFGHEHVHHSCSDRSLFNHQTKCPICHYELVSNAFIKSNKWPWFKQPYTDKITYVYTSLLIFELHWFKGSRAPPVQ